MEGIEYANNLKGDGTVNVVDGGGGKLIKFNGTPQIVKFEITGYDAGSGIYEAKSVKGLVSNYNPATNLSLPDSGESLNSTVDLCIENEAENNTIGSHVIPIGTVLHGLLVPGRTNETPSRAMVRTWYLPPTNNMVTVKIVSAQFGGKYFGLIVSGSPTGADPTQNLSIPDTGEALPGGSTLYNCMVENTAENGDHRNFIQPGQYIIGFLDGVTNLSPPIPNVRACYMPYPVIVQIGQPPMTTGGSIGPVGGKYTGTILTGAASSSNRLTALSIPETGDVIPGSTNCLIENTLESGIGTNLLTPGTFVIGIYYGVTSDSPPIPLIRVSFLPPVTVKITGAASATGKYTGRILSLAPTGSDRTVALSLPDTGEGLPSADNCLVENAAESGASTNAITTGTFCIGYVDGLSNDTPALPVVRVCYASGGLTLSWGKLTTLWTPGTNTVTLTPCVGPTTATATGAANVTCYISFPAGLAAVCMPSSVGDILAYIPIGGGSYKLFDPPQLPRPTLQYQIVSNTGGATVNYTSDWVRAHA